MKKNRKGFTLVELVVVLVILAILMAILVPSLVGYINKAKNSESAMHWKGVKTAANAIITEKLKHQDQESLHYYYIEGTTSKTGPDYKVVQEIEELSECGPDREITGLSVQNGKVVLLIYRDYVANKGWWYEVHDHTGKVERDDSFDLQK